MSSTVAQLRHSHPILTVIAAGDALGLPYEGTQPQEVKWGFFASWGITSDDTQQAHIALRALRESKLKYPRPKGLGF